LLLVDAEVELAVDDDVDVVDVVDEVELAAERLDVEVSSLVVSSLLQAPAKPRSIAQAAPTPRVKFFMARTYAHIDALES
jgi:hypothetical protein